jgi:hypothetical protein
MGNTGEVGYRASMNGPADSPPCAPVAGVPILLIGNELALFRDVLAGVFEVLRPTIPVRTVPVAELDTSVTALRPWLVICSALSAVIQELACAWILIDADANRPTVVSVAGEQRIIPHPTVDELVQLVDEAWERSPAASSAE